MKIMEINHFCSRCITARNIIWHIAHHGGGSREDIPARQNAPTLMPLAQVGQPHLDTASSAPRGTQHDISKGWLGRDRHQHVDMSMELCPKVGDGLNQAAV
jgi:hypothetical protein